MPRNLAPPAFMNGDRDGGGLGSLGRGGGFGVSGLSFMTISKAQNSCAAADLKKKLSVPSPDLLAHHHRGIQREESLSTPPHTRIPPHKEG